MAPYQPPHGDGPYSPSPSPSPNHAPGTLLDPEPTWQYVAAPDSGARHRYATSSRSRGTSRRTGGRRSRTLRPATIGKLALTIVMLMGLWTVAGGGTYAALTGTTVNSGNTFSAGTVTLTDNDANGALFTFTNQKPGVTANSCIKVTYTGSVTTSSLKMYVSALTGTAAPYVNLTVTKGTDSAPAFSACTNFTADTTNYNGLGAGVLFNGTLSTFPAAFATGLADPNSAWTTNTAASYRFTVSFADTDAIQGLSSAATFTWEARS